jgi:hypothetical protein
MEFRVVSGRTGCIGCVTSSSASSIRLMTRFVVGLDIVSHNPPEPAWYGPLWVSVPMVDDRAPVDATWTIPTRLELGQMWQTYTESAGTSGADMFTNLVP